MSLYDLPKNGVILMNSKTDSSISTNIILASFQNEKNVIVHHENTGAWLKKLFTIPSTSTLLSYSSENVDEVLKCENAKNVIFIDFSIFCRLFETSKILRILNTLKKNSRVFIPADETVPSLLIKQLCRLSATIYNIKPSPSQTGSFLSTTVIFDKKGRVTTQEESITFAENSRPIVKKLKTDENSPINSIDVKELQSTIEQVSAKELAEKAARDALELPFISGRQEDGVSIRDASKKKIRVGGQIIYEPDQADDLDDSDPDDDLNI